jgi:ADP-heptose:LPS heptosyltransferase
MIKVRQNRSKKQICYHIDNQKKTVWNHERFLTQEESLLFKCWKIYHANKFEFIPLGLPKSLEENIQIIAESDLFIGIDSGLSHVAHSVGIPNLYLKYFQNKDGYGQRRDIHYYHPNKTYQTFNHLSELEHLLS